MSFGSPYSGRCTEARASTSRRSLQASCSLGRAHSQIGRAAPPLVAVGVDAEVERDFGGRFLPDYTKKRLLGRGACGAVWLAAAPGRGTPVAIKQVAKGSDHKSRADERSAKSEIAVGDLLFGHGGVPRLSPHEYPGMNHITKLLDALETKSDLWLVMEFGGDVLSKALFDIKGEFVSRGAAQPRERVYRVHHLPAMEAMKQDLRQLKRFLREVLQALVVLSDLGVVHADLKPDNLLVDTSQGVPRVRLCDFGSAFMFDRPGQLILATPEYMPPEALEACIASSQSGAGAAAPPSARPWSFDMWSLGAILLELCYGVPHWLSYKCRVKGADGKKDHTLVGLFAVAGRDHERIVLRQQEIIGGGLHKALRDAPGISLDSAGLDLLQAMLQWDPGARISPQSALMHPFLLE